MPEENTREYINEKYGEGTIVKAAGIDIVYNAVDFLSSGSRMLNQALSGHYKYGMKRSRLMEIFGPEGCGKTTVALHFSAEAAARGIPTYYVDAEHALDLAYAESIGVDLELFDIVNPECGEDAFEIAFEICEKENNFLLVFDSVPAMVPKAQLQGNMHDSHMALLARMMSVGVSKLQGKISKARGWAIFINQIRYKVGVFYGSGETQPGGNALKFYTSYRLDIRSPREGKIEERIKKGQLGEEDEGKSKDDKKKGKKKEKEKSETVEVGKNMRVKTIKNKAAPPYKTTEIKIVYGMGIDKTEDLLRFFESRSIIELPDKGSVKYNGKKMKRNSFLKMIKNSATRAAIKKRLEAPK